MLEDLTKIVSAELKGLVAAGADFIQIDEPNFAMRSDHPQDWLDLFDATVDGVQAKIALHICFGNLNNKRFAAPRTYAHLFPHILQTKSEQLVLEFANREMGKIDLWQRFPNHKELGTPGSVGGIPCPAGSRSPGKRDHFRPFL